MHSHQELSGRLFMALTKIRYGKQLFLCLLVSLLLTAANARAAENVLHVGVAQIDITPDYPVRLSGFGFRRTESEGVTQKIWAKALAFADKEKGPAVLITADNLCVPIEITQEIADRLKSKIGLRRERLAITATHTHTAPMLKNVCPTLFGLPIPPEHQANIDRYTKEFVDHLERVALAAFQDIRPSQLEWGIGKVGFAMNRRTKGGPVDHDLPVLVVRDLDNKTRAVYFSYACHCVTLSNNKIGGDWAGFAQEAVQKRFPGAIALASVGCGADSNPSSGVVGDKVDVCTDQGDQIAAEVHRLIQSGLTPITAIPEGKLTRVSLPFDKPRSREEWEQRAKQADAVGHHARVNLARLDRGEKLPEAMEYPIQTWSFGDQLALIFMPGEMVVDYSLRLKREFDRQRLWINAYANEGRCYIPSERILKEGGYEGGGAMIYYDMPQQFAPGLEQKIIDAVHGQLLKSFKAPKGTEGTVPRSPADGVRSIKVAPGLKVELVASEPLIADPIAIDWDAAGRLWVCEMNDYPSGMDGNWQPGGRVKRLEDTNGDGQYDKATLFMENLPFPTGITAWGRGVFICAAPDLIYAEDTDGDGKADKVQKLYTGFPTDNFQARLNSLSIGLDNWIYGANGLLAGVVRSVAQSGSESGPFAAALSAQEVNIRNRDFRIHPRTGLMEPASGLTQQGRVRDDWGNWFGCDNSRLLLYFPTQEHYVRRNPRVAAPEPIVHLTGRADGNRLFPASPTLERFNDPGDANRATSACGVGLYRDTLLGESYYGNAFTCEPVHNLVHREIIQRNGLTLKSGRVSEEQTSEFLASTDNWFRPAQVRTGPDGALYVVDMYRFLIEHPRWIPAARLSQIDVRAGADKGRIYRVVPQNKPLRAVKDLTSLNGSELARALDTPNGTERDRVHVELLLRNDVSAPSELERLAKAASLPQVRIQALCVLEGLGKMEPAFIEVALSDRDEHVREHAVRLSEPHLRAAAENKPASVELLKRVAALVNDPSPLVVRQVALSLGDSDSRKAGEALAALAQKWMGNAEMRSAVLSSSARHCGEILKRVLNWKEKDPARASWVSALVASAAGNDQLVRQVLDAVLPSEGTPPDPERLQTLAGLLDALSAGSAAGVRSTSEVLRGFESRFDASVATSRRIMEDQGAAESQRRAALSIVAARAQKPDDLNLLCSILITESSDSLREIVLRSLRRQDSPEVPKQLLSKWARFSPGTRQQVLGLMIGRDEWVVALLNAAKEGTVQVQEISLADRQRLVQSSNGEIRQLATSLFPAQTDSTRAEVLSKYQAVLSLKGDAARGRDVFSRNCASCHVAGGTGSEVGPNLDPLRSKDAEYWLKNILEPNAVVEPRFISYDIELKDERSVTGIIKSESATSLTVVSGGGTTETILRSQIEQVRASSLSLMPEGLEQTIPLQEMANLIAFVRSGSSAKKFPGNEPKPVAASPGGVLMLSASHAEIYGDQITFESEFKNIGMWHGRDDHVAWTVEVPKSGLYDIYLDYACANNSAGNKFVLSAGSLSISGTVAGTGGDWSQYKQAKIGEVQVEAGARRVTFSPGDSLRGALIDLRTVALAPAGTAPKWPSAQPVLDASTVLREPVTVARFILDSKQSNAAREAAVGANPQFAASLIVEMTKDLIPGTPAEYERIPWIWRVAIACGRRNDAHQLQEMLKVSLPKENEPLHDWQSVVLGGGIINGLSDRNVWPRERLKEIAEGDKALQQRLARSVELSSVMADNEKVPKGTRYDALRMLGIATWDEYGKQLVRYLPKHVDGELQMGAVSGLADVNAPEAAAALIDAMSGLTDHNRKLALNALLRDQARVKVLLEALAAGKIKASDLSKEQLESLRSHKNPELSEMAKKVLP